MEPILKITGTEIYILGQLQSSGLEGPAYAEALRKAEELVRLISKFARSIAEDIQCDLNHFAQDAIDEAVVDYL